MEYGFNEVGKMNPTAHRLYVLNMALGGLNARMDPWAVERRREWGEERDELSMAGVLVIGGPKILNLKGKV